ncbi:GDYXXLXY domain-containing protein [Glaesserella sp.]|uniref:GDYXXLXY domain-containing protein n=1 Tax=Glaesserella sp. TaxID=2094731 RepID=UPI0035A189D4
MTLFNQSWEKYLRLIFALLAVGLFSSGVVTFIASNWEQLTKFQKLYGVQALLVTITLIAVGIYRKESRQHKVFTSGALLFVSLIVIGALLALIGQIYQTGADPWQLFAVWTLLQLPLLLCFPNIAGALLFLVTLNLTLLRYQFVHQIDMGFVVGVNVLILGIIEYTKNRWQDPWFVVSKVQNLLLAGTLIGFCLGHMTQIPLTWILSLALLRFYQKQRADLFNRVLHFLGMIVSADLWLLENGEIMLGTLLTLGAIIFIAVRVKKEAAGFPQLRSHLALQILYLFLAILGTVMLLLFLFFLMNAEQYSLLVVSAIAFGIAMVIRHNESYTDLAAACVLIALWMWIGFWFSNEEQSYWVVLGMGIGASVIVYMMNSALWLRTVIVIQILVLLFFYLGNGGFGLLGYYIEESEQPGFIFYFFSQYAYYWLPLVTLILFYSVEHTHLRPLAWGFLLFYLYFSFSRHLNYIVMTEAAALPEIHSVVDFIHLVTFNLFVEPWSIFTILHFIEPISPLVLFFLLNRGQMRSIHWSIAVWISLFSLMFISSPLLAFCFSLMLLAYTKRSTTLFVFSLLAMMVTLGLYYYSLWLPLLYKSYLLLASGILFAVIVIYLYRQYPDQTESEQDNASCQKRVPFAAFATLIFTLSIANVAITQNEDVLKNGQSIVLKLAPQDPRSLMQGDYMVLNYALLEQVYSALPEQKPDGTQVYALLKRDENGVAVLCRVEFSPPKTFTGCAEGVYVPINVDTYWNLSLPTHAFFFPEGKASYYNQAQYGEYRFKDGKILLARLLDGELKPL